MASDYYTLIIKAVLIAARDIFILSQINNRAIGPISKTKFRFLYRGAICLFL